jgi:hypothetical protein
VNELEHIEGSQVGAVCFVQDYVELDLDAGILRSLADPVVVEGEERHRFPEAGSRDALCRLIGGTVRVAEERPDQLLVVFDDDRRFEIPRAATGVGPEVAHFVARRDGELDPAAMYIWENLDA